ncbi:MAG: RluA family pseudouridine synthase [Thermodesulfovibrionia bacterium]
MKKNIYKVVSGNRTERLDVFVSTKSGLSRSYVQRLIKEGLIFVNSLPEKAGYKIRNNDLIELTVPDEPEVTIVPEDIPLDIIWEDSHIAVINKPHGMVIYPAAGHKSGTLLNALISKFGRLSAIGGPLRPGIVHRLDKDTSGLIVVAKDDAGYLSLSKQFKEREVQKIYLALLYGNPKNDSGEINSAIGFSMTDRKRMSIKTKKGKEAITLFEVVKRYKSAALVKVRIITGRTHQIRVHFAASGYPVLGDKTYGRKTVIKYGQKTMHFNRQMLHACSLKFRYPADNRLLELTAPLPEDMEKAIKELSECT